VIAKMWNVYTQLIGAVHDSAILGHGYLFTVDFEIDH
jgi:hypothetical protein